MSWFSRQVGHLEQGAANVVGGVEDAVGAHDAAKTTRMAGDMAAADQGVHVEEKQLGETEWPNELIHGDPDQVEKAEQVLTKYSQAYERIGEGLRGIDTHDWQGKTADKFRSTRDKHAKDWHKGADSYQQAAEALQAHRHTVIWGQKQAAEAIRLWNQAKQERKDAAEAHNAKVEQYNKDADKFNKKAADGGNPGQPPTAPGEFHDPSGDTKAQAKAILKHAREQVHTSGGELKSKLTAAWHLAPPMPSAAAQKKQVEQTVKGVPDEAAKHVFSGVLDSVSGTIGMVRGSMPMDPYNMSHPAEYGDHMSTQAAGMLKLANHPSRLPKSIAQEWKSDPAHAAGELWGDVVTGGGGAGGAAKAGAKVLGKATAKTAGKEAGKEAGKATGKEAGKEAGKQAGHVSERAAKRGLDHAGDDLGKIGRQLRDLDGRMHDPGQTHRTQADTPPSDHHQAPPKGPRHQPDPNQHTFDQANRSAQRLDHNLQQRYRGGHDPGTADHPRPHQPEPHKQHTQPPKTHSAEHEPKQQLDHAGQNLSRIEKRLAGLDEHMHDDSDTHPIDPYLNSDGVMKNKFGIRNQEDLDTVERDLTHTELAKRRRQGVDVAHRPVADVLKDLHRRTFGKLYDWGGENRTISTVKGDQPFANPENIESRLEQIDELRKKFNNLEGVSDNHEFAKKLSIFWAHINEAHPFREGNGRITRAYLDELARHNGRRIDWDSMDSHVKDQASIKAMDGDPWPMVEAIEPLIHPL